MDTPTNSNEPIQAENTSVDINQADKTSTDATNAAPVEKIQPAPASFSNVQEELASRLKTSGPTVAGQIVDKLVADELTRRTSIVTKAFELLTSLKTDMAKIKPDIVEYDPDNVDKVIGRRFSQKVADTAQKLKKRMNNLENAINQAIGENSNYQALEKALQSGGNDDSKPTPASTD